MRALAPILLLAALALAGCSSDGDGAPSASPTGPTSQSTHVELTDNAFDPKSTSVKPQTAIHFDNEGSAAHTVTIHKAGTPPEDLPLDQRLAPGEGVEHKFGDAGTYHVWCKIHGTMTTGMAMVVTVA